MVRIFCQQSGTATLDCTGFRGLPSPEQFLAVECLALNEVVSLRQVGDDDFNERLSLFRICVVNHADPESRVIQEVAWAIAGPICPLPIGDTVLPVFSNLDAVVAVVLNLVAIVEKYGVCMPASFWRIFDFEDVSNAVLEQLVVSAVVHESLNIGGQIVQMVGCCWWTSLAGFDQVVGLEFFRVKLDSDHQKSGVGFEQVVDIGFCRLDSVVCSASPVRFFALKILGPHRHAHALRKLSHQIGCGSVKELLRIGFSVRVRACVKAGWLIKAINAGKQAVKRLQEKSHTRAVSVTPL